MRIHDLWQILGRTSIRRWLIVAMFLVGFTMKPARADDAQSLEYPVKAAMLFNFTQFVEWPKEAFTAADAPLVIGVAGDANPFGDILDQLVAGKKIAGRSIVVKYKITAETASACHMLFVPLSADGSSTAILSHLSKKPVLTVGETEAFMKANGMARFFTENNKVHFEMNPDLADGAGVKISSKLLKLARIYKK